ncbi:hypothetical protein LEP1GSC050_4177 [Leptospira broomii serovar Hurstbridge str. 5399]|uniref:YCII-related domain-containing protein n=2 Tax=Leptospira broomii TaxID=301541 RepID=T0FCB1_9LEPT|nr:hypothetical protein LEP1GSC050_4177 [Leptospira broomii serovar Hurstbridge str. 5399]
MKYLLLMQLPYSGWKTDSIGQWPPEDVRAHLDFLRQFNRELTDAGELVDIVALVGPEEAKIVRAGKESAPLITDGPFAESKEFLAGFWIVDVKSPQRALELAARASAGPGRGGIPLNMPIEVRQVMDGPG